MDVISGTERVGAFGFDNGLDEIVLLPEQVETVTVTKMILRPSFSCRFDVVAHDHDGHIGSPSCIHGFGDSLCVFRRAAQPDVVIRPIRLAGLRIAFGDLAAFGVIDFDLIADLLFDAIKDADLVRRAAAVFAKLNTSGVGTNDRDRANPGSVERNEIVFVLEQDDGFARSLQSQGAVLRTFVHTLGLVRVNVGMVQ